jgi:hypothetical protein
MSSRRIRFSLFDDHPLTFFLLLYGMTDRDGFLMRMFNFLEWKST